MVVDYFIPGNLYSFEELPDSAIGNWNDSKKDQLLFISTSLKGKLDKATFKH
jgi:hypothetical protein